MSSLKLLIKLSLKEVAIKVLIKNGCTFYDTQIILLNKVILKSSRAQKAQVAHQRYLGKVRQGREIRSTQVYDKR